MNGLEYYFNNFYNPQNFGSTGFYQIPDERLVKKADVSFDPINYNPNQRGIGLLMKMLNPNPVKRGSEYGSGAQSFTSLIAHLSQDKNRDFTFGRCLNGTKCSVIT